MKNITPLDALRILKEDTGAILIDVRTYGEVEEESIPGAKHIPLDELPSRLDEIENFSNLLFLCRSGGRSSVAASIAESSKLPGVMNVVGGIIAWREAGLPIIDEGRFSRGFVHKKSVIIGSIISVGLILFAVIVTNPSASTTPSGNNSASVAEFGSLTPSQFATAITGAGVKLVDVRTPEEYASGHIANATNIDFYNNAFRDNLNTLNKSDNYYIYCHSGSRSGKTLTMMRALGFTHVHDLSGGINSWIGSGYPLGN